MLLQSEGKELYEASNTATPLSVMRSSVRRTRILIVEDERHIARLLELVLRKADYEVFVCHCAEEAIVKVDQCHPDAMLLDLVLPGMSGLEFLRIIRAAPYVCSCAVVVLSSRWLEGTTAALQEAGAAAQCSKPIAPTSLLRKLRELGIHHSIVVEAK